MSRPFRLVDVFGSTPLSGNPLAVVHDADGLTTEEMQRLTRWFNLSETAFLLPPTTSEADYRVRIFTLARELPFAGHPTLGSCHAWIEHGGRPRARSSSGHPGARVPSEVEGSHTVVQECGAGLVPLRVSGEGIAFAAPPMIKSGPVDASLAAQVADVLRLDPARVVAMEWVDNGPGWIGVLLGSAEEVLAVEADASRWKGDHTLDVGIVGPYPEGSECAFEVRALFTADEGGMREDPVTGSLNASLAQWLIGSGRATPPYVTSQGTCLGRAGRPRIDRDADGTIWIGGRTVTFVNGTLDL